MLKDQQVKADINNVDEEHQAALHYAARYNHYEIVKLLVENGAGKFLAGHIDMNLREQAMELLASLGTLQILRYCISILNVSLISYCIVLCL